MSDAGLFSESFEDSVVAVSLLEVADGLLDTVCTAARFEHVLRPGPERSRTYWNLSRSPG